MTVPLVFLDTETTSLHPELRRPWEIAIIRREPDGTERRITILIRDVDLSNADPMSLKIGRFHDRHPRFGGPVLSGRAETVPGWKVDTDSAEVTDLDGEVFYMAEYDAATVVDSWTKGAHMVGAVPDFDSLTLDKMLRRHGLLPRWHYHLVDVETLAVGWLHGVAARAIDEARMRGEEPLPELLDRHQAGPPWKSDDISRACLVEPPTDEERHTAMGDALWVMRWYDRIVGAVA